MFFLCFHSYFEFNYLIFLTLSYNYFNSILFWLSYPTFGFDFLFWNQWVWSSVAFASFKSQNSSGTEMIYTDMSYFPPAFSSLFSFPIPYVIIFIILLLLLGNKNICFHLCVCRLKKKKDSYYPTSYLTLVFMCNVLYFNFSAYPNL